MRRLWIRWFAVISVLCFVGFIVRELRTRHPIVNLRVLKNRNFAAGVILMTVLAGGALRHDGGAADLPADDDGLFGACRAA